MKNNSNSITIGSLALLLATVGSGSPSFALEENHPSFHQIVVREEPGTGIAMLTYLLITPDATFDAYTFSSSMQFTYILIFSSHLLH